MQILAIVLYGYNGKRRVLPFIPGRANIIVGDSKTGKSSLADIIEYCLGKENCYIAEGIIREYVAWFGIHLQFQDGSQMFLARENPGPTKQTTNKMYYSLGDMVSIPESLPEANTKADDMIKLLTSKVGISPNLHTPPDGQSRLPLAANIKHALIYCFQSQSEIDQKNTIFHNQEDSWIAQAVKDTIPYFLGAIQEERLALEQELSRARRELKLAERELQDSENIKGKGSSRAISLIEEACQVGVLSQDTINGFNLLLTEPDQLRLILSTAVAWKPGTIPHIPSDRLSQLQSKLANLQDEFDNKVDAIRDAKLFAQEAEGFTNEVTEQALRLESIGLYEEFTDNQCYCPFCSQHIDGQVPSHEVLSKALKDVRDNLETIVRERPRLREYINRLSDEKQDLAERIISTNAAIDDIYKEKVNAAKIQDLNARQSKVVGRISLWLESISESDEFAVLKERVDRAKHNVERLEKLLEPELRQERLTSILNRIGIQMTQWARTLELEHSQNPIRLDIGKLTIIADREDRPIPLYNMGSGENWVGYHLVAHLALHLHFRKQRRPVPGFLFLDQPSQAYFPTEYDDEVKGDMNRLADRDRESVNRMFELIFDVVNQLSSDFQVIITDHADLKNERFRQNIVEKWRNNRALVPRDWYQ